MKKSILLIALAITSSNVLAYGGGGGGTGAPSLTIADLQKGWNGKAGNQVTFAGGVRAHWVADDEGRVNGNGLAVCSALPETERKPTENCNEYMPQGGGQS